ncbi:hypothetical protein FOL47_001691 [Perkinsus chesapeaki]|uniref:Uncharacterized protein n=1 Tax=Perkinsus chesapeaki TaxID=330153 RepID=A0A7J6MJE6_PERCH|nr:hypothetical protein FOL47_001691 [Perkinsus chesapeaki]
MFLRVCFLHSSSSSSTAMISPLTPVSRVGYRRIYRASSRFQAQMHPSEARPPKFIIPPFEGDYKKVYKHMWRTFRERKKLRLGVLCNPPHGAASELPDPKVLRDYEVAPTCYRAAESQIVDDEFWLQMCERIRKSKDTLSVSDIAAILDSLVMVNYRDTDLMRILSREIIDDMFKLTFTEAAVIVNAYSTFNCESKPLLDAAVKHCHALAAMNRKGNDVRSCAVLLSGLARFKPENAKELVEVILSSTALNAAEGGLTDLASIISSAARLLTEEGQTTVKDVEESVLADINSILDRICLSSPESLYSAASAFHTLTLFDGIVKDTPEMMEAASRNFLVALERDPNALRSTVPGPMPKLRLNKQPPARRDPPEGPEELMRVGFSAERADEEDVDGMNVELEAENETEQQQGEEVVVEGMSVLDATSTMGLGQEDEEEVKDDDIILHKLQRERSFVGSLGRIWTQLNKDIEDPDESKKEDEVMVPQRLVTPVETEMLAKSEEIIAFGCPGLTSAQLVNCFET